MTCTVSLPPFKASIPSCEMRQEEGFGASAPQSGGSSPKGNRTSVEEAVPGLDMAYVGRGVYGHANVTEYFIMSPHPPGDLLDLASRKFRTPPFLLKMQPGGDGMRWGWHKRTWLVPGVGALLGMGHLPCMVPTSRQVLAAPRSRCHSKLEDLSLDWPHQGLTAGYRGGYGLQEAGSL